MSRFIKISKTGKELKDSAKSWDAVLDRTTGLMWSAGNVGGKSMTWSDAKDSCASASVAGFSDWQLPTVEELFALADRSKYAPAIDTEFFPTTKSDWYWSGTVHASSSGYAWIVYFHYGYSDDYHQNYKAFVRAVRRAVPAGQ